MNSIWLHLLVLIPVEFGLLHATPLGPMITGFFTDVFAGMGFEFAQAAAGHGAAHGATEAVASAASSCGVDGCTLHGSFANAATDSAVQGAAESYVPAPETPVETLDFDK